MKNFDLNNYGVQEMNTVEKKEIDGGGKLIQRFWYTVGGIFGTHANSYDNHRDLGGTVIDWKF